MSCLSNSVRIGNYLVCLHWQQTILEKHYTYSDGNYGNHTFKTFVIGTAFLDRTYSEIELSDH